MRIQPLFALLLAACVAAVLVFAPWPAGAEEPSDPAGDPPAADPADPADPAEPTDPADPADPAEPADPPASPPVVRPELSFEQGAVVIQGLTPGGQAVLFGVGRLALGYHQRVVRFEEVLVADDLGLVVYVPEDGVPPKAVWAAIDLPTGEVATSASPGFPGRVQPFPTAGLRGRGGAPGHLSQALESAQVLYARPGQWAWGTAFIEGARRDLDGADDGVFEVALADFLPVRPAAAVDSATGAASDGSDPAGGDPTGEPSDDPPAEEEPSDPPAEEPPPEEPSGPPLLEPTDPPAEVAAGDVVVVVDPTDLTLFTLRVTPDAVR